MQVKLKAILNGGAVDFRDEAAGISECMPVKSCLIANSQQLMRRLA